MNLSDFLISKCLSMGDFAKRLGTTTATVSRINDGSVIPRKELLRRIHAETRGLVTPNDLTGLHCNGGCPVAAPSDDSGQKLCDPNEPEP